MHFNLTTFLFELVNFTALVWLLSRLLYKPLREAIAARRAQMADAEERLSVQREELERGLTACAARERELSELRAATIRDALEVAERERIRMLDQAREDASAERARAERLIDAERKAAADWLREVAVEHSTDVAGRMLLALAPEAVDEALFEQICSELPGQLRAATPGAPEASEGPVQMEVSSAKLLKPEQVERLRGLLQDTLKRSVEVTLHEDPELMAGLLLRVNDHVVDASVRGQLSGLRSKVVQLLSESPG